MHIWNDYDITTEEAIWEKDERLCYTRDALAHFWCRRGKAWILRYHKVTGLHSKRLAA